MSGCDGQELETTCMPISRGLCLAGAHLLEGAGRVCGRRVVALSVGVGQGHPARMFEQQEGSQVPPGPSPSALVGCLGGG